MEIRVSIIEFQGKYYARFTFPPAPLDLLSGNLVFSIDRKEKENLEQLKERARREAKNTHGINDEVYGLS